MSYEQNGAGWIDVPPEVVARVYELRGRVLAERDAAAARELVTIAESYHAVSIAGYHVAWWSDFARQIDEAPIFDPVSLSITLAQPNPTTTGEPMSSSSRDVTYPGTLPADLCVEYRPNGDVRFRIRPLVGPEAVVDIPTDRVDALIADLNRRGSR